MKQRKYLGGYITFVVGSVIFAAMSIWIFLGNLGDVREYSATAEATIVAPGYEHIDRSPTGNGNSYFCTVDYTFTDADGIVQEGTFDGHGRCTRASYLEGAHRDVYFDPDNSSNSTLSNPRGFWLNLLIDGVLMLSLAVVVLSIRLLVSAKRAS